MFKPEILASNIKKYRKKQGLKQGELAEKLFVSAQSVSKWECGSATPDMSNLCGLSNILNVSIDNLLGNLKFQTYGKTMIGIDGGGTKTEFVLFSETGKIISRILLDESNPNSCGIKQSCHVLKTGIDTLLAVCADVSGIFAGIAGFFSGNNGDKLVCFLKKTYPNIKIKCGGDILNVIASAEDLSNCAAVICGTGSVVYANVNGEIKKVGGWGYLLDGAGSGYDIGRDALCAALAENEGIGPQTALTQLIEKELGTKPINQIDEIYKKGKSYIASLAPLVFQALGNGDQEAERIMNRNMDRLAFLIDHVMNTYDCGNTIVLSGGILSHGEIVLKFIRAKLDKKYRFVVPELPQIFGACVQCCRMQHINYNLDFMKNFSMDYKKYI